MSEFISFHFVAWAASMLYRMRFKHSHKVFGPLGDEHSLDFDSETVLRAFVLLLAFVVIVPAPRIKTRQAYI